jgi:glutamate formiminotransferase
VLECVPNVSAARDRSAVRSLESACAGALLDVHIDDDHNRSVFTLAGPGADDATDAAVALATAVAGRVSLAGHAGVHPRLGALDVVPFVALEGGDDARAAAAAEARAFGVWWSEAFAVPVFFYDDADDQHRDLPSVRRDAFVARPPDCGPPAPHPELGATAVGARRPLVAINCELTTDDVAVARAIAARVRGRDGGVPGVRALGFRLERPARAQVSMNVTDLTRAGIEVACTAVQDEAVRRGTAVAVVELVGLVPEAEFARCSRAFLAWSRLSRASTIEARLRRAPGSEG